jgi:hypothetical protein
VNRGAARFVHASVLATAGTGAVYAWMRWWLQPVDEFAVVNHPWQPTVQHLHVLAAPLLVFAVGLLWSAHALPRLREGNPARRRTGLLLVLLVWPMVLTGVLVQVVADERWRAIAGYAHGVASALWTAGYGGHALVAVVRWARSARRAPVDRGAVAPDEARDLAPVGVEALALERDDRFPDGPIELRSPH